MDSNRATINPLLEDGRKVTSRSGKVYTLAEYETMVYKDRNGEDVEYRTFKVVNSGKKKIGTITQYTTEERLNSLIRRFEEPDHMTDAKFIAKIGETNGYQYIVLNDALRDWFDMIVDDAVTVTIERKDGLRASVDGLNVAMLKTSYIVNLSRMRRCSVTPEGTSILSVAEFKSCDPNTLFLHKGDVVEVTLCSEPENQNYNLADSMRAKISHDRKNED